MGFRSNTGIISIIIEDPSILPVTLIYFKAMPVGNSVRLEWVTDAEINNDYFEIERSKDGINFINIDRVAGSGNSNQRKKYVVTDFFPLPGTNYYRLKQVDFDGTTEYFNIVAVDIYSAEKSVLKLYPNPATDVAYLNANLPIQQVFVSDLTGRVILTMTGDQNDLSIQLKELVSGQYVVYVILQGGKTESARLMVK
jgi:hypothetical protein